MIDHPAAAGTGVPLSPTLPVTPSGPDCSEPTAGTPDDGSDSAAGTATGVVLRVSQRTGVTQVLLCRTENSGWQLPHSRPTPGETPAAALARQLPESTGQIVWVSPHPDQSSGRRFGCHLAARRPLRLSAEFGQLAWLPVDDLPDSVPAPVISAIRTLAG